MARQGEAPRIAVLVKFEVLGDALIRVPFAHALHRAFPEHEIWWIASDFTLMARACRHITAGFIDHVVEGQKIDRPLRQAAKRLAELPRFDMVFDTRTRFASVALARLVLRPRRYFTCLPGLLLSSKRPPGRWTRSANTAERTMTMYEAATGKPAPRSTDLALGDLASSLAERALPPGPAYLGFAPGASDETRCWPVERFAELATMVKDDGFVPVFLLGPKEADKLAYLREKVPDALFPEQVEGLRQTGVDPIEYLLAVARRLTAAVTNDSGPAHALALSGTPILVVYGVTNLARWAPWTDRWSGLQAQDLGFPSIAQIPAQIVHRELQKLLEATPLNTIR